MSKKSTADWRTPTTVLVCGGIILSIAMGIRHGFGLFLQPISHDLGWGREIADAQRALALQRAQQ